MTEDIFENNHREIVAERVAAETLIVDVDGYEGPLDLLLTLSRTQKVDLRKISILDLAKQYLEFVERAKTLRIELAADYLVMAAWLAFLKSRLLLPPDPSEEGPSGEDLAAHLAFQLQRLQAMRDAAARLMARDRLGRDFFQRGVPESVERTRRVTFSASLLDLMQAYARIRTRDEFRPFVMDRENVFTMESALERMRELIGFAGDWTDIASYLPEGWRADRACVRFLIPGNGGQLQGGVGIAGLLAFVPYQLRHSGPSWDKFHQRRGQVCNNQEGLVAFACQLGALREGRHGHEGVCQVARDSLTSSRAVRGNDTPCDARRLVFPVPLVTALDEHRLVAQG